MENSSYKRRLDDMYFQSSPFISSKRKKANEINFSTISAKGQTTRKSFLEPFEERYRYNVSPSSMRQGSPFAARPYVRERTRSFVAGSSSEYPRTPLRQRHYSPRSTWSNGTGAEVSAPSLVDGLGVNTPEVLSLSAVTDLPLHLTRSALGYSSFAMRGVVDWSLSSKRIIGVGNTRSRFSTGVSETRLNGLSKERIVLGNFEESSELAKFKEEKRAVEEKLVSALRREPGLCDDLSSRGRRDMEQADVTEVDRITFASAEGDDKWRAVITNNRSDLEQARLDEPAHNEALLNGTLEGSVEYHVVGKRQSGENADADGLAGVSERRDIEQSEKPKDWRALYQHAHSRDALLISLKLDQEYVEKKFAALSVTRPTVSKVLKKDERDAADAFTPLSEEAEYEVDSALLGSDRNKVLTYHEKSSIDVTRAVMQCLLPGAWLNDEVINLYMELLKERELQEPKKFLKCHFFNTFFYNKLFKDKRSYDYKAVRRWTTVKKVGYSLLDCDKILVPIHQDIHWCLAVINIRDKRLEYLDSLRGGDNAVLKVLARYIADEAKDKDGKVLDSITWEQEFPEDIPQQLNGCDCGMFMLKYADFHSRGVPLTFKQGDMQYFRRRMVWELLQLKAT